MSDNDASVKYIGNQMLVRNAQGKYVSIDPIDELNFLAVDGGLSISEAIRKYTNLHGLPKGF